MDDGSIDGMRVQVRADTAGFGQDVAAMRADLESVLVPGAQRAGRAIEASLLTAVRTGRLAFEELRATALKAMDAIAAAALHAGVKAVTGGGGIGGLLERLGGVLGGVVGAPGRATGGPVTGGRPYWVGERGPELFVPAAAGRIEPVAAAGPREVRVAITVNASGSDAPAAMARSARQVARAVKAALEG
ncbi:hypothetical protein GCM10011380_19780 [Sphingomonas metalli]|uniref:Tail tape measure protein n=1 Tax=Sphingomonas metalli TaxID=1779358 RepID=A0A916WU74_9SPHN|nr:tail tape measure protein [Sphingomonas metalli]GGB30351.1 hypothetical protein GCM10011380_19780 [Sphingomonas metalli]